MFLPDALKALEALKVLNPNFASLTLNPKPWTLNPTS